VVYLSEGRSLSLARALTNLPLITPGTGSPWRSGALLFSALRCLRDANGELQSLPAPGAARAVGSRAAKLGESVRELGKERIDVSAALLSTKGTTASVLPNPNAWRGAMPHWEKRDGAGLSPPAAPEHGDCALPNGSAPHPVPEAEHEGQAGHTRGLPSPASHLREDQEGMPRRTMTLAGGTFPSTVPPLRTKGQ